MGQSPLNASVTRTFQGAFKPGLIGQQNDLWASQRHGTYYAATYGTPAIVSPATVAKAGSNFRGSNSSSAQLSAALVTTYTGLCLSNPAGSGLNLVVNRVMGVITAAPTLFMGIGLITGWAAGGVTSHVTSINTNIVNGYVGAAASSGSVLAASSIANLDAACTLVGTPAWDRWLVSNASSGGGFSFNVDINQDIIVPPGGYVAVGGSEGGPASFFTFGWEELPQ